MSSKTKGRHKEAVPAIPTHRFAKFNPFRDEEDEGGEELGDDLTLNSVVGGGRGTFEGDIEERKRFHVSHALRVFLSEQGEISKDDIDSQEDGPPVSDRFLAERFSGVYFECRSDDLQTLPGDLNLALGCPAGHSYSTADDARARSGRSQRSYPSTQFIFHQLFSQLVSSRRTVKRQSPRGALYANLGLWLSLRGD